MNEKYQYTAKNSDIFKSFLADTWWFCLTSRLTEKDFQKLATLRVAQGFNAIQLVVGIPPEVGIRNVNAISEKGVAWDEHGEINQQYLQLAKERIAYLNKIGLTAIVYGAWGHQIDWIGIDKMKAWWEAIILTLDDLDVVYCLTGESNIWIGESSKLLPDKSTDDLGSLAVSRFIPNRLLSLLVRLRRKLRAYSHSKKLDERKEKWSKVLAYISKKTNKPILLHPVPTETSHEAVQNSTLLAAETVQTGHDYSSINLLWQHPKKIFLNNPNSTYINLEPWYEGIRDSFYTADQLYSYWVSMLSGANAYCYGAHGVWNVGDGTFLSHWGSQTLTQAMQLQTPYLIGISYKFFIEFGGLQLPNIEISVDNGHLVKIKKSDEKGKQIIYYPEYQSQNEREGGEYFLPLSGSFTQTAPDSGPLVIFRQ